MHDTFLFTAWRQAMMRSCELKQNILDREARQPLLKAEASTLQSCTQRAQKTDRHTHTWVAFTRLPPHTKLISLIQVGKFPGSSICMCFQAGIWL